jgi:tetratricopeptide (TPR) repeat protein
MNRQARQLVLPLAALLSGFATIRALQKNIDAQLAAVHQERDDLLLRSGRLVKILSLGYDALAADLYWTRAVQYYGDKHSRHDPNLELLAPLLDLTVTLDPHLVVAYQFGAIFLAQSPPQGAGRPDLAVDLIRRGIQNNPDHWRLWSDLAFIYYWELKDYQKASEAFLEGSKNPQAGEWMRIMAAKVAAEGRSYAVSMFLWKQVYESTKDPLVRKNAFEHLQTLKAEEDARQLEELVGKFRSRFGRTPSSMVDLVDAGLLARAPLDPAGLPYVLGSDGKVYLSPASPIRSEVLEPPPGL